MAFPEMSLTGYVFDAPAVAGDAAVLDVDRLDDTVTADQVSALGSRHPVAGSPDAAEGGAGRDRVVRGAPPSGGRAAPGPAMGPGGAA